MSGDQSPTWGYTCTSPDHSSISSQDRPVPSKTNVSTACAACRRRKTRCSGQYPCTQCTRRGTVADCQIDSTTDLRRRRVSETRIAELQLDRTLLHGLLETIRLSDGPGLETLGVMIKDHASKQELRAYINDFFRDVVRSSCSRSSSLSDSSQSAASKAKTILELLNPDV